MFSLICAVVRFVCVVWHDSYNTMATVKSEWWLLMACYILAPRHLQLPWRPRPIAGGRYVPQHNLVNSVLVSVMGWLRTGDNSPHQQITYLKYLQFLVNSSPPWTKWPSFCRRHFWMHFMKEMFCISIQISLKFVPKGSIDNKPALVQVMALAPNRRQAIIWPNADPAHRRIYAALGREELMSPRAWSPISAYSWCSFCSQCDTKSQII